MSKSSNKPNTTPPQQRQAGRSISIQQASLYQGIIPSPQALEHYERISPGFASRIISLTEDEGNHRRKIENRVVNVNIFNSVFSKVLAFSGVIVVCGLCYFTIDKGYATQGASIACAVIVSLALAFLAGGNKK